jgi:hypothetical protein
MEYWASHVDRGVDLACSMVAAQSTLINGILPFAC